MSIEVNWPIKRSTSEKATRDCLKDLSPSGLDIFLTMPDWDRRKIFEMINESGKYVPDILLKR